jgi:guanylate cyclase
VLQGVIEKVGYAIDQYGATDDDSEDTRLRKNILVVGSVMLIFAGALWGIIYIIFNEPLAGGIPIAYSTISLFIFLIFGRTRDYIFYQDSQLLLILMIPFLLMIMLGGFFNSSAVIIWSLICPLGALLLVGPRRSARMLLAYLGLLILSGFLQPYARIINNLPEPLVILFFIMNIGVVSTIIFVLLSYFVRGKEEAMTMLRREQEKSEQLLLNVLPKKIASILKEDDRTIAEHFDSVSVLFADVVKFSELTNRLEPDEMVELLNDVFTYFDTLVEKYKLEKIRTIGDNYMVASGAPIPRADHAQALAHMALEMNDCIAHNPKCGDDRLEFRIGINSGPAVGGVIGQQKFHYDLWGVTVNAASRMESQGLPGKIQISDATHKLIKDEFECSPRGSIDAKGIGEIDTWFLEGIREQV